jgi:hypothetical protein
MWPHLSTRDRAFPPRQGGGRWFEPSIVHSGSYRGFGYFLPGLLCGVGCAPPIGARETNEPDGASVIVETAPVAASDVSRPLPEHVAPQRSTSVEPVETAERAAEHQKLTNEVLGHGQPHAGGADAYGPEVKATPSVAPNPPVGDEFT